MLSKCIFIFFLFLIRINNTIDLKNNLILATIQIPKINLIKNLYDINSKENNVDLNLQILSITNPNNNYYIIAGHNGNTINSYFKHLDNLNINDKLIIYYNNNKYLYKLVEIYEIEKNGYIKLKKASNKVILITCKTNNDYLQVVYTFNSDNIDK